MRKTKVIVHTTIAVDRPEKQHAGDRTRDFPACSELRAGHDNEVVSSINHGRSRCR